MNDGGSAICQACAEWQRIRALDQEDHWDVGFVGEIRTMPGQVHKLR
jgi:hypothetical protein